MKSLVATLLTCSAVVALGLGIGTREPSAQPTVPSAIEPATHLLEHAAPRTEPLRVMPTVYVTATVAKNEIVRQAPEVMGQVVAAVGTARAVALGGSGGAGSLRSSIRSGLVVPYFAFAQAGALTQANGAE